MNLNKNILLIEDEEDTAALIKIHAESFGYRIRAEKDGISGFRAIAKEKPDLVLLDIMLPGQNGLDLCKKIKHSKDLKHIPIIMISARTEAVDIILGLELGAEDYIVKPFHPRVLFYRIKAVFRRNKENQNTDKTLLFGDFVLDIERFVLKKRESVIFLTLSEFHMLKRFLLERGHVLTRAQLLEEVQNDDGFILERNVDVHIASLRKKLGSGSIWIETIRGIGYRFKEEEDFI
ncbi:Alkaline phosphatase synthesis transcriptional regulatory protein PhoP [Candidatus Clavichlamydia salmonicola]|uniref:response regulator transcription factor n=1 Tax=Candidatus Clavichlamydia salmonicola TaxID=469812 RepID=UPI001891A3BC|nr:response regulator transcription factor [Candidatus Clavichlamydia salmonicola]MBF5050628.1 Alkaline phosphatase synthesis transcriptional regulatory protein PhoP [Candidatus Clavichlamydia salmonicola]